VLVKFIGHDPLLLTEYNGKKYVFHKNKPVEIDEKIFKEIILSGHISSAEVVAVEEPKVIEKPKETIIEKVKATIKPKFKKKK
jgi:hypothetical protein